MVVLEIGGAELVVVLEIVGDSEGEEDEGAYKTHVISILSKMKSDPE